MKSYKFKTIITLTVSFVTILVAGCEPENNVDQRQERLYSAENLELKRQINSLEKKYENDMKAKEAELNKCLEQNAQLSKQLGDDAIKMFEGEIMTSLMEQVQQLTKENNELKASIEEFQDTRSKAVK